MSKKVIHLQTQGIENSSIHLHKEIGFVSLCFDNVKITVDAYKGFGFAGEPREDSLIQVCDEKDVFEITAEQLLQIIRYYIQFHKPEDPIVHYRNSHHFILPDAVKPRKKGLFSHH